MDKETKEEPSGSASKVVWPTNSGSPSVSLPPASAGGGAPDLTAELPVAGAKLDVELELQKGETAKTETKGSILGTKDNAFERLSMEDTDGNLDSLPTENPTTAGPSGGEFAEEILSSNPLEGHAVDQEDGHDEHDESTVGSLDVDSNDTDSALGSMTNFSSTMSVNSGLYEHVQENGRTYHRYKEGKYALPNDETEQNRLDIQHQLFVLTLHGQLHLAPLSKDIHNVLDLATGTGIWAIEFAIKYPSANVLGVDLSPIQPEFVPPNCRFQVDDVEDDWNYSYSFDYIHGRQLLSCFNNDFPAVVAKSYEALNPGGWFELQDMMVPVCFDNSWDGTELERWVRLTLEGAKRLGMDWHKVANYKRWVEEAGFEDIREFKGAWPTNTWPRDKHHKLLGAWQNQNMMEGMHAISVAVLTRGLGMTAQEVEVMLVGVRRDLCDRNIHCYAPIRVIYGRKPGGEIGVQRASPPSSLHSGL